MKPSPDIHEDKESFARFTELARKVMTAKKDDAKHPQKPKKKLERHKPTK